MTEKITAAGLRSIAEAATAKRSSTVESGKSTNAPASGAAAVDTVSLTPSGRLLSQLEGLMASEPAPDTDRIAALKAAIASGRYETDAESIADRMIRMERDLG